jgi:hypothetical protein
MAVPPRLHVFLTFMLQFILLLALLGGVVPSLREKGISWAVLIPATALGLVVLHFLIAQAGKLLPVRCRECRSSSRYRGFGWWPFKYRYVCPKCGTEMRYEVG